MKVVKILVIFIICATNISTYGQSGPSSAWIAGIKQLAPEKATVQPQKARHVLLFSLYTGYKHDVIPYVKEVFKVLADNTNAFTLEMSNDIEALSAESLERFDAVILNNNCSVGPQRNIFLDVLTSAAEKSDSPYTGYSEEMLTQKAGEFETGLIRHIKNGAGLMAVHGAIVMQNNSKSFNEMLGGNFDFHPKNQVVHLDPVEPGHPLLKAFGGKSLEHKDEPYIFSSSYTRKNFRPLLVMDTATLELRKDQQHVRSDTRYVSWIKKYGRGRIFYVSPSHNASSYENKELLQFYLDGLQYVLGDLKCDDSPMNPN